MSAAEFLKRLFACTDGTRKSELEALTYAEAGLHLGTKPWWPPLVLVWLIGPTPPESWADPARAESWRTAAALLSDLHSQYRQATGK